MKLFSKITQFFLRFKYQLLLLAGLAFVGAIGYVGNYVVRQYNNDRQIKNDEVEKLKDEVTSLKNQKPKIVTRTVNTEPDLPAIIKQWTPRIAKITCKYVLRPEHIADFQGYIDTKPEYASGSGFLIQAYSRELGVVVTEILTNDHVLSGHNGFSDAETCIVELDSHTYKITSPDDFRSLSHGSNVQVIQGKPYAIPNVDAGSIILRDPDPEIKNLAQSNLVCITKPSIGDSIAILGFPGIGSSESITATEGIISGLEDGYYVTSAKVEHGDSGGVAIWLKNNCYIGIPSFVLTGELESFARILDIKNVFDN